MGDKNIASIIFQNPRFQPISSFLVISLRHDYNFNFLFPIHTFIATKFNIESETDLSSFFFTYKSSFEIHPVDEFDTDIFHATSKLNIKKIEFGGISKKYLTPLIAKKGSINSDSYFYECINDSNLRLGMNEAYSPFQWILMQDRAISHKSLSFCMITQLNDSNKLKASGG